MEGFNLSFEMSMLRLKSRHKCYHFPIIRFPPRKKFDCFHKPFLLEIHRNVDGFISFRNLLDYTSVVIIVTRIFKLNTKFICQICHAQGETV